MADLEPVHLHHIPGLIKQILGYVYNTDELIGSGSFSVVYKGRLPIDAGCDSRTNSPVAIKVIDRRSITNEIDDMLLHNEVECHKIISHEAIIKTLDLCKTVNNIYIVCEFCESGDLFTYVKNKGIWQQLKQAKLLRTKPCISSARLSGQSITSTARVSSTVISSQRTFC